MLTARVLALMTFSFLFQQVQAAEISAITGLYRSEKDKTDGEDAGSKSEITLGAKFAAPLNDNLDWFVRPITVMRSYDAADGQKSASDSTSLRLFGGVRKSFYEFSRVAIPFVAAHVGLISEKTANQSANTETETSGLFYGASFGFRFNMNESFFVTLETALFNSALFATETTEAIDEDADGAPLKTEKTKTELYVDTVGNFDETLVGLGYKF